MMNPIPHGYSRTFEPTLDPHTPSPIGVGAGARQGDDASNVSRELAKYEQYERDHRELLSTRPCSTMAAQAARSAQHRHTQRNGLPPEAVAAIKDGHAVRHVAHKFGIHHADGLRELSRLSAEGPAGKQSFESGNVWGTMHSFGINEKHLNILVDQALKGAAGERARRGVDPQRLAELWGLGSDGEERIRRIQADMPRQEVKTSGVKVFRKLGFGGRQKASKATVRIPQEARDRASAGEDPSVIGHNFRLSEADVEQLRTLQAGLQAAWRGPEGGGAFAFPYDDEGRLLPVALERVRSGEPMADVARRFGIVEEGDLAAFKRLSNECAAHQAIDRGANVLEVADQFQRNHPVDLAELMLRCTVGPASQALRGGMSADDVQQKFGLTERWMRVLLYLPTRDSTAMNLSPAGNSRLC
jgi:hypothetical protein